MENFSVLSRPGSANVINETGNYGAKISSNETGFNPAGMKFTAEEGINIFRYLKRLNLTWENEVLILSSGNHYYYDENDLKGIRTLINLKKLNLIKDIDTFFSTICSLLPPDVNFVGCFSDSRTLKGNGFLSELSARFNNLLDSRTDNNMDRNDVKELLEKHYFTVEDITRMNGLTYFYAKKISKDPK